MTLRVREAKPLTVIAWAWREARRGDPVYLAAHNRRWVPMREVTERAPAAVSR